MRLNRLIRRNPDDFWYEKTYRGVSHIPTFTKKAIKESFLKLLDERPLNQITVKDIVEDCGINRNSFYYHFADIPTMVTEIITERADQIIAQYGSVDNMEQCLSAVTELAADHKRGILHIYRSVSRDTLEEYMMRICRHAVETYTDAAIGEVPISPEDREILIRFAQCEIFGQTILWLGSGMSYDIESQFSRLCQLMAGLIDEVIRRAVEDVN